ncbi:MAG: ATP-binding protein [Acetivibrionales bacterium]|jgi:DNA polymerase-3 subunit delta'
MDYIGQTDIVDSFRNCIKHDTLGHAFVLTGETGIGKKTLASFIAKALLCSKKDKVLPCGHCRACKSFDEGINPNLFVIRSETRNIVIKQIRELINNIGIRPLQGRKVYIIEDADRMTNQAQNCLLRKLEEPPAYAKIILTTANYEALLSTIRSRIIRMNLKPYSINEMKLILQKNGININDKEHLLSLCRGIPGKAIQLMADKNFEVNREITLSFVFEEDTGSRLSFNQYLSRNKNAFNICLEILESLYRDALLVRCSIDSGLINSDKKDNILKYANMHSIIDITERISRIEKVRSNMKRNMNYQLAVDMITLL